MDQSRRYVPTAGRQLSVTHYRYLTVLLFFLAWLPQLTAQDGALREVALSATEAPLSTVLLELAEAANVGVAFNSQWPEVAQPVRVANQQQSVQSWLEELLTDTGLGYEITPGNIAIFRLVDQRFRLSGYLEDAATGERLVQGTVYDPQTGTGAVANDYGFFSLALPPGPRSLVISYLGYQNLIFDLDLRKDEQVLFALAASLDLPEIIVEETPDSLTTYLGNVANPRLNAAAIRQHVGALGEYDLITAIHQQTGVQRGADGLGGFFVRGGGADENLVLLDDAPLFLPTHSLGLFSVIHPGIIRSAQFYQEGFPARYGGRLASVTDVRSREGNTKTAAGEVDVSTIATKLLVEIPLRKDESSLLLAGRRTHLDPWVQSRARRSGEASGEDNDANYYFYDLNVKFHQRLSKRDRLFLSAYRGADRYRKNSATAFAFVSAAGELENYTDELDQQLGWSNTLASVRWNRLWNDQLFSNATAAYSRFRYRSLNSFFQEETDGLETTQFFDYYQFSSVIQDYRLQWDMDYYPNNAHHLRFGVHSLARRYRPGILTASVEEAILDLETISTFLEEYEFEPGDFTLATSLYLEEDWRFHPKGRLHLGLRATHFQNGGQAYYQLQPRLRLEWQARQQWQWHLTASRMGQFVHLLTFSGAGLPTDLWVASNETILPKTSTAITAGTHFATRDQRLRFGCSVYYQWQNNILRYVEESQLPNLEETSAVDWEAGVDQGIAYGWGLESKLEFQHSVWYSHLTYAWQRTSHEFTQLNDGFAFPANFERPHKLSCQVRRNWG
ncbi:MAG: TonB-dependent receptor, partial [Bacteroidota bacterium]